MGVKFNIQIIGKKINRHNYYMELIKSLENIYNMLIGYPKIATLHNIVTEEYIDYDYNEIDCLLKKVIDNKNILFIYPDSYNKGCISITLEKDFWVLCLSIERGTLDIEYIIKNTWENSKEFNPLFILAGEELELVHQDILFVLNRGIRNFSDIELCEFAMDDNGFYIKPLLNN